MNVGIRNAAGTQVTALELTWISACLILTELPDIGRLPLWLCLAVTLLAALRVGLALRGRDAPPRALRLLIAAGAIALLFLQFRTFNGLNAGSALLCLIAGLKLLETRTRRDLYVIVMIIYFLCLSSLLAGESFWLLAYLIGVCWLTTSTLLTRAAVPRDGDGAAHGGDWRRRLRYAGRLLAQAVPLAIAFWLFFPRFGGPLWQMPVDSGSARSGLGDSMSPGDITDLALSDEVAMRVRFNGLTPPATERYWRGPVLNDFDGQAWQRGADRAESLRTPPRVPPLRLSGPAYRYTLKLEPTQHAWLFALDWPTQWNAPGAMLTADYMLVASRAVTQPIDVEATSYGLSQAAEPLDAELRRRDTRLPPGRNPRTREFARQLQLAHPDAADYVAAVLDLFHRQAFYYTLKPPPLSGDAVDGFLFDTRRGFCGHYASAFATLTRAAGIPTRVVTGYQGGTYNRFADYWIVRQSDAHAWDEVWIEGRGWQRVDPTAAVAPERVEHGLADLVVDGAPLRSRWQQRTPWFTDLRLRADALRLLWRERILDFNADSQDRLLEWLHVPEPDGQKLALLLAVCLIAGMSWLTWQVGRDIAGPVDPLTRAYARLCRRLTSIGIHRLPHEGADTLAARVARLRPDLAGPVSALCRDYSRLRYGRTRATANAVRAFAAAVARFRPRATRTPRRA